MLEGKYLFVSDGAYKTVAINFLATRVTDGVGDTRIGREGAQLFAAREVERHDGHFHSLLNIDIHSGSELNRRGFHLCTTNGMKTHVEGLVLA